MQTFGCVVVGGDDGGGADGVLRNAQLLIRMEIIYLQSCCMLIYSTADTCAPTTHTHTYTCVDLYLHLHSYGCVRVCGLCGSLLISFRARIQVHSSVHCACMHFMVVVTFCYFISFFYAFKAVIVICRLLLHTLFIFVIFTHIFLIKFYIISAYLISHLFVCLFAIFRLTFWRCSNFFSPFYANESHICRRICRLWPVKSVYMCLHMWVWVCVCLLVFVWPQVFNNFHLTKRKICCLQMKQTKSWFHSHFTWQHLHLYICK